MKRSHELVGKVFSRHFSWVELPLWPDGPSFKKLFESFVLEHVQAAELDDWIPMASEKTWPIVAFFFQGAVLRLAEVLEIHQKPAILTLLITSLNYIYKSAPHNEIVKLILDLEIPKLDGEDEIEGFHLLGAKAMEQWIEQDFQNSPPTKNFLYLKNLTNSHAVDDAKNPPVLQKPLDNLMDVLKKK